MLLQRLRNIRQLAMAYLVYPGALHTRFDHTLGVLQVTGKLCEALRIEDDATAILRLAALLHDVGHGPFSHVSEQILDALSIDQHGPIAGRTEKIHEKITQRIILEHPSLSQALSTRDREDVARLLQTGLGLQIHRDIISGPLDADKQDYLLRDSYFCGVRYGVYDIDQLHNSLCRTGQGGDAYLAVQRDGVHALEQFVLAKYYLTTQVYRHKVRLITDNMLIRGITLGVLHDRLDFLQALYRYDERPDYLQNYLAWDDQRLTVKLLEPAQENGLAGKIFRRLAERRLFKRVFSRRLGDLPETVRLGLPQEFDQARGRLEESIAEELRRFSNNPSIDSHEVILHLFKIESVRAQSRNSERSIMVVGREEPRQFEEESTLFKSINEELQEEWVECYAPVSYRDDVERQRLLKHMDDVICRLIESEFSTDGDTNSGVEERDDAAPGS
ncbi:MAG: HD domain-containing protein [Candidatus Dormibacteraceae bacterium]